MNRWIRVLWIVGVLALVVALIWVGYGLEVTGFAAAGNPKTQPYQPAKTVWDWLQLLIVPAVLAGAALWFNAQQGKTERQIAQDQQEETMLQGYLDRMADLLLKEHLGDLNQSDEVRQVARAHTLTILRRLDAERKTALFQFLYEAELVGHGHNLIRLDEANLSGVVMDVRNLIGASLNKTILSHANLVGAILSKAHLVRADLSNANLVLAEMDEADLSEANLDEADLRGVNLVGADLSYANLKHANLREANLSGAKITEEQLKAAKSLEGATLPDGTKHA